MAFTVKSYNPQLHNRFLSHYPARFMPNPAHTKQDLQGIKVGKFFSRIFDFDAWVKKAPRTLTGAASGYLMGGGWTGAAAGAATAAAFRRRSGTSLFQDVYRGGLYGMIGGSAVGVGKELLGYQNSGFAGDITRYVKNWISPQQTSQVPVQQWQIAPTNTTGTVLREAPVEQMNPPPADVTQTQWRIARPAETTIRQTVPYALKNPQQGTTWLETIGNVITKPVEIVGRAGDAVGWENVAKFMAPVAAASIIDAGQVPEVAARAMHDVLPTNLQEVTQPLLTMFPVGPSQGMPGAPAYGPPGGVLQDIGMPIEGGYGFNGGGLPGGFPGSVLREEEMEMPVQAGMFGGIPTTWLWVGGGVAGLLLLYFYR